MSLRKSPEIENPEGEGNEKDARVKNQIAKLFDEYGAHDAVSEILKIIEPFLKSGMITDSDGVVSQLEKSRFTEVKNDFVENVFSAQGPIFEFRDSNPEKFQQIGRQSVEHFPINEVLSYNRAAYGKDQSHIFIHLDPVEHGKVSITQIKDGLKQLAKVLEDKVLADDESIKVINANSWITAKQPGILEKLGFTLGKTLTDEEREKYFPGEKRPVRESSITCEQLLENNKNGMYGKK